MTSTTERKSTIQRFVFGEEIVAWTSYKIERDDTNRSYASCNHPIFRKYFGQSDTLVANLVNLSHLLEDGTSEKIFFSLLLNSYIIE